MMGQSRFISPRILECMHFCHRALPGEEPARRIVKDYEIDINVTGERVMWVDGKQYDIAPGSVVCRVPGQQVEACGNFDMYALTLDFSGREAPSPLPIIRRNQSSARQPTDTSYYWDILPTCFIPRHSAELLGLYKAINEIWRVPEKEQEIARLLATLFHLLLADAFAESLQPTARQDAVTAVTRYINEHFAEPLSLDDLADAAALNKSYLVRLFRQKTGVTPMAFLNRTRLAAAQSFLKNAGAPLRVIAEQCGFSSPAYFIARFQKEFGITPGEYRRRLGGQGCQSRERKNASPI